MHAAYYAKSDDTIYDGRKAVKGSIDKSKHDDVKVYLMLFLQSYVLFDKDAFYSLYVNVSRSAIVMVR